MDAQAQMDLLGRAMEKLIERCAQLQERTLRLEDLVPPVGTILAWHKSAHNGAHIPDGWFECNGQTKVIDNRTYTVPNLNSGGSGGTGLFIRGGAVSGVLQASALAKHKHAIAASRATVTDTEGNVMDRRQMYFSPPSAEIDHWRVSFPAGKHAFKSNMGVSIPAHSSDDTGAEETRPENMSMVWIMRVF
jgi:microcystin-dependent protein